MWPNCKNCKLQTSQKFSCKTVNLWTCFISQPFLVGTEGIVPLHNTVSLSPDPHQLINEELFRLLLTPADLLLHLCHTLPLLLTLHLFQLKLGGQDLFLACLHMQEGVEGGEGEEEGEGEGEREGEEGGEGEGEGEHGGIVTHWGASSLHIVASQH